MTTTDDGIVITEPGLVHGLSDEDYHGDPIPAGSLSSTFARLLTEHVPAKAKERRNRKPTKSMNLGKAAHAQALGTGPELIVWQYDGRTREGKAERAEAAPLLATEAAVAVTIAQRDQILGMADALRAEPVVAAILDACESEVSAFWQEGGVWLRARYDLLGDKSGPWDYKTAEDASRRGFQKSMANYGYHQQADIYQRGLKALGHPACNLPLRFICQETEPPYLIQIHTPDDDAMAVAEELNDRAIRVFADALARGVWDGYAQLVAERTSLPAYYFFDHEEQLSVPSAEMVI